MKVLGITTTQEVYIGSREKNFRNNEYLIVEDPVLGDIVGEIVEANTINRFIPLDMGGDFIDTGVLSSLKSLGYDIDKETVYIGKLRFFEELLYPPITGSDVRVPIFSEVKDLLIDSKLSESFVLGSIKNTDNIAKDMDDSYRNLFYTFEKKEMKLQNEVPYLFNYKELHQYPHIGVFGGSGSGKSFGLRVILEEIMQKNIPTIVLDPHYEMDFSENSAASTENFKNSFKCLEVGIDTGIKFQTLNKRDIKVLLSAVSDLTESMENVIDIMFVNGNSFESFKNKLELFLEASEYGNARVIENEMTYVEDEEKERLKKLLEVYQKYSSSVNAMSVRGVFWRLLNINNEGMFSRNTDELEKLLKERKLVVLQGSTRSINVFTTYLLNKLYNLRKTYRDELKRDNPNSEYFPPFIIVTDEAHNFAPKGFDAPSKSILKEISQEGRKYGVFLILATQRPTLLDETITAQLNTKFIFRTVRASDIDTIKEETDLSSNETKRLPYLKTGDVFISSAQKGRTSFVRIRAAKSESPHRENPFDELENKDKENLEEFYEMIKNYLPIAEIDIINVVGAVNKNFQKNYNIDEFKYNLDELVRIEKITFKDDFLGNIYREI